MKLKFFITACLFSCIQIPNIGAQTDESKSRERLESAISQLNILRARISEEKIPLSSKLRALETEVIDLRRESERKQRLVDNQSVSLTSLEEQAKAFDEEAEFSVNTLNDLISRVANSLSPAEVIALKSGFESLTAIDTVEGQSSSDKLDVLIPGLDTLLDRMENLVGGYRFPGEAIDAEGRQVKGNFAAFGPITYFASPTGVAGLVARSQSGQPAVVSINDSSAAAILKFVETGEGTIPLDPTLGRALAIRSIQESPIDQFKKGGLWMWPIGLFGITALIVAAVKFIQLLRIRPVTAASVDEILGLIAENKEHEANEAVAKLPAPGSEIVAKAVAYRLLPKELLEELMFEVLLTVKPRLERMTFVIALTASVAPLLGLLGTVTGMIRTFNLLTLFGTGDAKSLSSGISEALLTTAFGLIAAIPALLLAAIITRIAANKIASLEKLIVHLSNSIAASQFKDKKVA